LSAGTEKIDVAGQMINSHRQEGQSGQSKNIRQEKGNESREDLTLAGRTILEQSMVCHD
jgi:hypothetical protein